MTLNKSDSSLWLCLQYKDFIDLSLWTTECLFCRFGSLIILFLSISCLKFNIRYMIWYQQERYRNLLVLSLFLASSFVLLISVPGVILQLFTCHQHCIEIYCRIEGFTSYFSGCLCMVIYMVLSIDRYLILRQYNHVLFEYYSVSICWLFSLGLTLPPVFNYWISYVPEGLGFHCSINWNDYSTISFYYILISFITIYFLPLIILIFVNLRVHKIIRDIYSFQSLYRSNERTSDQRYSYLFHRKKYPLHQQFQNRSSITSCYLRKAADRKRLRAEYRFVRAVIFLVGSYIFAWTPYSINAVLQMFHNEFIFRHTFLITLSALIAKLSVILAPFVYLSIMNFRLFKKILLK